MGKDLGLRFETPKSPCMDDPVSVPLKVIAVSMRRLGDTAASRVLHAHRVLGEHGKSLADRPRPLFSEASIAFRLWVQSPGIRRAPCRRGWRAEIRRQIPGRGTTRSWSASRDVQRPVAGIAGMYTRSG